MYKVFIDNHPILFLKNAKTVSNLPIKFKPYLLSSDFDSFIAAINQTISTEEFFIKSPDPMNTLRAFFKDFEWIEAAGGIVKNTSSHELLFILRNKIWDIPKGKIEVGESPEKAAIREIQEECGIENLKIISPLSPTFHAYYAYGKHWIKKTHWFILETDDIQTSPQHDEGITKVKWFEKEDLNEIQANTYVSILEVLKEFKETSID